MTIKQMSILFFHLGIATILGKIGKMYSPDLGMIIFTMYPIILVRFMEKKNETE